jgi:transcriptional regulator with XRE-family HTH domain
MIATIIKKLRTDAGISQEQMATLLNMTRITYNNIEIGKRELKFSEIEILENIFEISRDQLFGKVIPKIDKTPKDEDVFYKFKQVFLYILNQCAQKPTVGKTVLNKLLYFADFNYYEKNFESITGVEYIKLPR